MTDTCPHCGEEIDLEGVRFGADVECPTCHSVLETDFEVISEDSMNVWLTGVFVQANEQQVVSLEVNDSQK